MVRICELSRQITAFTVALKTVEEKALQHHKGTTTWLRGKTIFLSSSVYINKLKSMGLVLIRQI